LRYFHSSINNHSIIDRPVTINIAADLARFLDDLIDRDFLDFIRRQRPNTTWVVHKLTNVTFYLYKILNVGRIGAFVNLPSFIRNNKFILSLDKDVKTGKPYSENLCFFRALSILLQCKCTGRCRCWRPSEKLTRDLFQMWKGKRCK
jgi:hypothetical protein